MSANITVQRLQTIFKKSKGKKIAVIGDVMLDKYVYGDISRISPEAPVPVVEVKKTDYKLGGAANVANNIKALEAEPVLIGVIGNDYDSDHYLEVMKNQKLSTSGIFKDKSRPTTSKTRVISHSQHVLRVDHEAKEDISDTITGKVLDFIKSNIKNFESVIMQDYNKGVLRKEVIAGVIEMCKKSGKHVYVDPKFHNFFEYKDITLFKPNRKEVGDVLGIVIDGEASAEEAGRKLMDSLNCKYLVLTRGEKGMKFFTKAKGFPIGMNIHTRARKVADVSGAGDTVISTIAVMLAGGADIVDSVMFANRAAGIVCEEVGIIPIYKKALLDSFKS
ncbi:MAG: D-glycero-beta-D-manno-heptose-7-phosphate kinase [Chlorobi bacterium]|nr:D-glycero-beta-D-manno-heptose-7-phosphate kinase [Chlorobiota bacterium]MCI0715964.1 D-glycero-beta-D-manno-heptose-7-phosphate kinase [Chlorobiota bacterium]